MIMSNNEAITEDQLGQGQGDVTFDDVHRKIPKLKPDPELDNFLGQVDQISEVIKALASDDVKENEKGFRKADILLRDKDGKDIDLENPSCRVTSSRTVINKIPDEQKDQGDMSTQGFMKMVEQDAKERAQDRKERKLKSDKYRKKGNILFAKKDFAGSLFNYNEAIKLIKDSPCLYNNRALTYLRLGIFSSAIEDCKRAIDLDEFSLRARMFMAKSYFLMEEPDKCREILQESREQLPGHVELINDYQRELFNMGSEKSFEYDLDVDKKWKAAANYEYQAGFPEPEDKESNRKSAAEND